MSTPQPAQIAHDAASVAVAECDHPRRKHTVWYWVEDGGAAYGPMSSTFDNLKDALRFAQSGIDQAAAGATHLRWIKVFRADNESYTCFRWQNPDPMTPEDLQAERDAYEIPALFASWKEPDWSNLEPHPLCHVTLDQYPDPRECAFAYSDPFDDGYEGPCHLGHPANCRSLVNGQLEDERRASGATGGSQEGRRTNEG